MRLTASVIELAGSLVIVAWGFAAALAHPWCWRWWARRPSRAEGGAIVVIGLGSAVWSVGEGIALLIGTAVQLTGIAGVVAGGVLLALAVARADREATR